MIKIPKKSFYFVRHGETDWNRDRLLMGSQDIPLNNKGRAQAEHAAYILDSLELGKAFSSNLKRASQTAKIIANIAGIEVQEIDGLAERNRGSLEGKIYEDPSSILMASHMDVGGEKYEDFESRVLQNLIQILYSKYQCPLVVSHGGVFAVFAKILAKKKNIACRNGEAFCFVHSVLHPNRWEIKPLESITGIEF